MNVLPDASRRRILLIPQREIEIKLRENLLV